MKKAQISVEFLTILSLFLLIFLGISLSLIKVATKNTQNVYDIITWKSNKILLKNAVDFALYTGGGKIIYLYKPENCNLTLTNSYTICISCENTISKNCFVGSPEVIISPISSLNKSGTIVLRIYKS